MDASTEHETEKPSENKPWNMLYLLLAIVVAYFALDFINLTGDSSGVKKLSAVNAPGQAFNVKDDIKTSKIKGVAMYELSEGSIAWFNTTGANANFNEMGKVVVYSGLDSAIMTNGVWDNPYTSDSIVSCASMLRIKAVSKSTISFTKR